MAETIYFPPPPRYHSRESSRTREQVSPNYFPQSGGPPLSTCSRDKRNEKTSQATSSQGPKSRRHATWRLLPASNVWTLVDEWWLWELISWTFAAVCMAAIAGLLAGCSGKPIPSWPWGLTINAYVSILGAFVKAAMLLPTAEALGQLKFNWFTRQSRDVGDFQIFDQASRGPWGSLVLILRTKGRALGAFGAAIVLLSIALDPFFQQVVIYPSRRAPVGNSTIVRSRLYTAGRLEPHMREGGYDVSYPDPALEYYLDPLLYFNETAGLPDVPLSCTTGDCVWEPFSTLGMCNECADVSHLLEFACLDSQHDWTSDLLDSGQPKYLQRKACGYYINATSSDPVLMTGYDVTSKYNETLLGRLLPLSFPTEFRLNYFDGSVMFKDVGNPIIDTIYVFTPGGHDAVKHNITPVAKECNLHWCIQEVKSTVHDGVLQETVLNTVVNRTAQPYPWTMNWTTWEYDYHATPRITSSTTNEVFGPEKNHTAYLVSLSFFQPMTSYFTYHNLTVGSLMRYTCLGQNFTITVPGDSTFWTNPANITSHFGNMAKVLSRVIRVSGNGTEEVTGLAMGPQTYVYIRWEWLSLPLILLGFSLVFLVSVIVQSRTNGMKIWKTSALAVLMHGLNDAPVQHASLGHAVHGVHTYNEEADKDERVMARFREKSGVWRFSHHHL